eukprot:gb/GEZN01011836.1/.p1 GENE.gb/GEZN01011836.1/~~gb/GEZN01011836.1/.p1  ORF type:complete len:350 (-),score=25.83 gb/GEZN01011836.1/:53-1102(-)
MSLSWGSAIKDTLSGGAGSLCCVYVGLPFDVVKMRLQTQSLPAPSCHKTPAFIAASTITTFTSIMDCARFILSKEGVFAFWKGATPAVASSFTENTVLFLANRTMRRLVAHGDNENITVSQEYLLGGLSGVISGTAITPAEQLKIKLQFQKNSSHPGVLHALATLYNPDEGFFRSVFKGWSITLARDVPYNVVQFGTYYNLCKFLQHRQNQAGLDNFLSLHSGQPDHSDTSHQRSHSERTRLTSTALEEEYVPKPLPLYQNFLAGGVAGMCAWGVIYPLDMLKSRVQAQHAKVPLGMIQQLQVIAKTEGYRGLYRGYSAAVMRAFPANGALFMGVEVSLKGLNYILPDS